ncbi:MAG: hypothetical protein ACOZAA_12955 [Pseudomonadota bacterium]
MQASNAAIIDIEAAGDAAWARDNLRFEQGRPALDIANCLRVLERHPDFKGRYRYNEVLNKVLDRGAVMIEWRMFEFAAVIQERFLPELSFEAASRALVIAANRANAK